MCIYMYIYIIMSENLAYFLWEIWRLIIYFEDMFFLFEDMTCRKKVNYLLRKYDLFARNTSFFEHGLFRSKILLFQEN